MIRIPIAIYLVAHKKRPQLCNDVVRLNSRIQTKINDTLKEQSELNSMRNYDFIRVSEVYKIANTFNMSYCMRSISSHSD